MDDDAAPNPEAERMSSPVEPSPSPGFRLGYRPELDGLRAIAILAVLLRHAPIPGFEAGILRGGWIGVDIFFVLSGFLITTLLLEEFRETDRVSLRRFYARRALRLGPALVTLLIVWCAWAWIAFTPEDARLTCRQAIVTLVYLSNWVQAYSLMPMDQLAPTWSLAIEEQFYLVWPIALIFLLRARVRTRGLLGIVLAGSLAAAALRLLWLGSENVGLHRLYYGSDTRADALLSGCLVGILAVRDILPAIGTFRRMLGGLALASVVLLAWVATTFDDDSLPLYLGLFTCVSAAAAVILAWLLNHPNGRVARMLAWPPMVWIGRRSYGIYLWNIPVQFALAFPLTVLVAGLEPHWSIPLAVSLALNLAVAALSYRYVEEPVLAWKRRFESVRGAKTGLDPIDSERCRGASS